MRYHFPRDLNFLRKSLWSGLLLACFPFLRMGDGYSSSFQATIQSFPTSAQVSWVVRSVESGSLLVDINGSVNRIPASTQKVVTTWVALMKLGETYTSVTKLIALGAISGDTLHGDLIIQAGGDPAFGSLFFQKEYSGDSIFTKWWSALCSNAIKYVTGSLRVNQEYLAKTLPNRYGLWEDIGNYYGAAPSPFCFNDNQYHLTLDSKTLVGQRMAVLACKPEHSDIIHWDSDVIARPNNGKDSAYIFGSPISKEYKIIGSFPTGRTKSIIKGSMPNPAWVCARDFSRFLRAQTSHPIFIDPDSSLMVGQDVRMSKDNVGREIARHESPPLSDIIRHINRRSDNMYADQLLCLLSKAEGGPGKLNHGLQIERRYLISKGIEKEQFRLVDGSGLSRLNWISSNALTTILHRAYSHEYFPLFKSSLVPVHQEQGRWATFYKIAGSRCWLKSGSLDGVIAFTGYVYGRSGQLLCFSFNISNTTLSKKSLTKKAARLVYLAQEKY